jgi:Ring finger domain
MGGSCFFNCIRASRGRSCQILRTTHEFRGKKSIQYVTPSTRIKRRIMSTSSHGGLTPGQCTICYEALATVETQCEHMYCMDCLQRWIAEGKTSCPICRAPIGVFPGETTLTRSDAMRRTVSPPPAPSSRIARTRLSDSAPLMAAAVQRVAARPKRHTRPTSHVSQIQYARHHRTLFDMTKDIPDSRLAAAQEAARARDRKGYVVLSGRDEDISRILLIFETSDFLGVMNIRREQGWRL